MSLVDRCCQTQSSREYALSSQIENSTQQPQAFSYPDSMPLSRIIASELTQSGSSILYAGALATVLSAICTQTIVYSAFVYRPIERLVLTLAPSSQARKIVRRSKGLLHFG